MPLMLAFTGLLLVLAGGCKTTIDAVVVTGQDHAPVSVVFRGPIPEPTSELRVYTLTVREDRDKLSEELLTAISRLSPELKGLQGGSNKEKCAAPFCRRDEQSGGLEMYPDFEALFGNTDVDSQRRNTRGYARPALPPLPKIQALHTALRGTAVALKDGVSDVVINPGRLLKYARHDVSNGRTPSAAQQSAVKPGEAALMYLSARRRVGDVPVDGPGSRLFIGIGARSAGLMFDWRRADNGAVVAPLRDQAGVKAEIERQLLSLQPSVNVYVANIQIAYYDGGNQLLQPVYRFVAEFGQTATSVGPPQRVVGYVPIAAVSEPVPSVDSDLFQPRVQANAPVGALARTGSSPVRVELGRYVVREDRSGWITDAEQFWSEASRPGGAYEFIDKQYYLAGPWQFTEEKNDYVNSVDMALIEAHGSPWGFSTRGDRHDRVDYRKEETANGGYGSRADGKLKHMILHSCAAVPAPPDQPFWAYPWLDVFRGLHSVVGYRTAMYIGDGAGAAFARSLHSGAPVVPAWFNAVASLTIYGIDDSASSHCGSSEPLGRASAVVACGSLGASPAESNLARSDCLEAWWIEDATTGPEQSVLQQTSGGGSP